MKRSTMVLVFVLLVALFVFGDASPYKTQAQGSTVKITDAIPTTSQTGKIFQTSFTYDYSDGRVILAGNETGTGSMFVDDTLYIDVTRPDGSIITYTHFLDMNFSPVDFTEYLQTGSNALDVRIENTEGTGETSAYWFVTVPADPVSLPFQITDAIPTVPFRASGSYFGRYFFVDYGGNGTILLSSDAEGTGLVDVNDTLYIQVTRPNGVRNIYTRSAGKYSVMDLTEYFETGLNLVHLWLGNTDIDGGSSALWLTYLQPNAVSLPVEIAPAIPAISPPNGDFFGRYLYVNYDGSNSLWLAGDGNGTGSITINGTLYFQVVQPDGRRHTYTHSVGTYSPVDLSNYFSTGTNLVHLRLEQLSGAAETSALFLLEQNSPPPTLFRG